MSGSVKNYNPKRVIGIWIPGTPGIGAIKLNEGIVDGTFFAFSRETRSYSKRIGSDGEGTRIKSNDLSGTVTATLRAGSPTNDKLSAVLATAEETDVGNIGPLSLKDFSGNTVLSSPKAYIEGWPDGDFSDSESDNEWVFVCHKLKIFRGGNAEAV